MTHSHLAVKAVKHLLCKNLRDQAHPLVTAELTFMIDGDAAAFLPPVLQGIETEIGQTGYINSVTPPYAENAAGFMYLFGNLNMKIIAFS
jgi:hypothetical protein